MEIRRGNASCHANGLLDSHHGGEGEHRACRHTCRGRISDESVSYLKNDGDICSTGLQVESGDDRNRLYGRPCGHPCDSCGLYRLCDSRDVGAASELCQT